MHMIFSVAIFRNSAFVSMESGDIGAASCRNHVCRTCRKLWGEVLLNPEFQ